MLFKLKERNLLVINIYFNILNEIIYYENATISLAKEKNRLKL